MVRGRGGGGKGGKACICTEEFLDTPSKLREQLFSTPLPLPPSLHPSLFFKGNIQQLTTMDSLATSYPTREAAPPSLHPSLWNDPAVGRGEGREGGREGGIEGD